MILGSLFNFSLHQCLHLENTDNSISSRRAGGRLNSKTTGMSIRIVPETLPGAKEILLSLALRKSLFPGNGGRHKIINSKFILTGIGVRGYRDRDNSKKQLHCLKSSPP